MNKRNFKKGYILKTLRQKGMYQRQANAFTEVAGFNKKVVPERIQFPNQHRNPLEQAPLPADLSSQSILLSTAPSSLFPSPITH